MASDGSWPIRVVDRGGGPLDALDRGCQIWVGEVGAGVRGLLEMSAAEADGAAGASWAVSCSRAWTLMAMVMG
ncbi:hypothetical protein ACLOJK_028145 [Asimina triloba]